jgi:hypothetical protein
LLIEEPRSKLRGPRLQLDIHPREQPEIFHPYRIASHACRDGRRLEAFDDEVDAQRELPQRNRECGERSVIRTEIQDYATSMHTRQ